MIAVDAPEHQDGAAKDEDDIAPFDIDDLIGIDDFDSEEADIEIFPETDLLREDEDKDDAPEITESEEEIAIAEAKPDIEPSAEEQYQVDDGMNRMIALIKDFDFDADVNFPKDFKALKKTGVADKKDASVKLLPKHKRVKRKLPAAEDLFSAVALYHAPDEDELETVDESVEPVPPKGKDTDSSGATYRDIVVKTTPESAITEGLSADTPVEPHIKRHRRRKNPASPPYDDKAQANRPPNSEYNAFLKKFDHSLKNIIENKNFDIKLEKVVTQMVKKKMTQKKVGHKLANAFEECILKGVKDFKGP